MKRPIFVLLLVFVLGEVIAVLKLNIAVFIPVILIMVIIKIITKKHAGVFCGDFFVYFFRFFKYKQQNVTAGCGMEVRQYRGGRSGKC